MYISSVLAFSATRTYPALSFTVDHMIITAKDAEIFLHWHRTVYLIYTTDVPSFLCIFAFIGGNLHVYYADEVLCIIFTIGLLFCCTLILTIALTSTCTVHTHTHTSIMQPSLQEATLCIEPCLSVPCP